MKRKILVPMFASVRALSMNTVAKRRSNRKQ